MVITWHNSNHSSIIFKISEFPKMQIPNFRKYNSEFPKMEISDFRFPNFRYYFRKMPISDFSDFCRISEFGNFFCLPIFFFADPIRFFFCRKKSEIFPKGRFPIRSGRNTALVGSLLWVVWSRILGCFVPLLGLPMCCSAVIISGHFSELIC